MSDIEKKFVLPCRLRSSNNIWLEYENLVVQYNPLDLGSGYPDYPPPHYITKTLADVAGGDNSLLHQYTRDYGHPRLVKVLAELYSRLLGRQIDAQNEILTTVGAQEALFSTILGHVDVGDEVIIIEPFYDCYESMVRIAGGVPKFILLRLKEDFSNQSPSSADWILDEKELESLFNSKTKVIILNNPQNSLGKVYRIKELEWIASLCMKWNVLCISDEVYEWIVYKPNEHIRIASIPGMWERTITIGSAGTTFSVTGWKLGWAYGPANLLYKLQMVHQNSVYTGITPIQEVVAIGLEKELEKLDQHDCYFKTLSIELENKRNFMVQLLREVGMQPTVPEGGYFVMANWSNLESQVSLNSENDEYKDNCFTKWMIKNMGILGIPLTPFYGEHKTIAEKFVKYCFFKKNETLEKAAEILKKWNISINTHQAS